MMHCKSNYLTDIATAAIVATLFACSGPTEVGVEYLDELDHEIAMSADYDRHKESEIAALKTQLQQTTDPKVRYELNSRLARQYEAYVCDSSLRYINDNIQLAREFGDSTLVIDNILDKVDVLSHAGLFNEGLRLQEQINPDEIDAEFKVKYYKNYYDLYQYLSEYSVGTEYDDYYARQADIYCDSVLKYAADESFAKLSMNTVKAIASDADDVEQQVIGYMQRYPQGTREYSILAADLAYYFERKGDAELNRRYLAESAISDTRGSVKENMSFRELSNVIRDRDLSRANAYLKKSIEDASMFSARLRGNQSAQIFPLIDRRYSMSQQAYNRKLKIYTIVIGVLAFTLLAVMIFVVRQNHKLVRRSRSLTEATDELHRLNEEMKSVNDHINEANRSLIEGNAIKEVYIKQLMIFSSAAISTLEVYRKKLLRKAAGRLYDDLLADLKSTRVISNTLKEFYTTFDTAFLNIFPHFVHDFNSLLRDGEGTKVKDSEMLNTELRIYALMKLGITDNQKIADFLRSSITTIYTYRSRVKSRAKNPDTFEAQIIRGEWAPDDENG